MLGCSSPARTPDAGASAGGDAGGEISDAGDGGAGDGGIDAGPVALTATLVSRQFDVADDMRASREMQLSGEPFAQLLGYQLTGFNRTLKITDQYFDPNLGTPRTDPLGYALAVESYEYSKQPMNNLSFESGAGLSLMFGPVLNPAQEAGDAGFELLLNRFQQFAIESYSGPPNNLIVSPAPAANPMNAYGWPGLWPEYAEFSSFDPEIQPDPGAATCVFTGSLGSFGYGSALSAVPLIANYECDYNSLNLPDRAGQGSMTLDPAGLGYVVWKQGLWTINYWQSLQDTGGNAITLVAPGDLASVGQAGNTVVGYFQNPSDPSGLTYDAGSPGVYLGDIPLEGWQGLTMLEEMDNKAQFLLGSLLTADGGALGGVSSIAEALAYTYNTAPLLYFPASVAVTEEPGSSDPSAADKYFPQPVALAIADGTSALRSLSGLIGGFAEAFAMTDASNAQVGGSIPFLVTFDGDPFPADDGLPDGESTLHDRALGVLKVALVDLDRLHWNAEAQVLVDGASVVGGPAPTVRKVSSVTTLELVEAILALRNAYRALNGTLQLYSNNTPDTQGVPSALDGTPTTGAGYSGSLSAHILVLITAEADFLADKLIAPDGAVANGYELDAGNADPGPTDLAAETAAIRGLLEASLATSNQAYRTKAKAVFQDLQRRFWMSDVLAFRTTAGVDQPMQYTPARFGMLQGALRQYYELVGSNPSDLEEGAIALQQIKRMFKLVANGWNDLNQDDHIQYPEECLASGLEMAERALTGELGEPGDDGDREHDCIREISYVHLPAALGAELDLSRQ